MSFIPAVRHKKVVEMKKKPKLIEDPVIIPGYGLNLKGEEDGEKEEE